jgi:hypothetical protein
MFTRAVDEHERSALIGEGLRHDLANLAFGADSGEQNDGQRKRGLGCVSTKTKHGWFGARKLEPNWTWHGAC